MKILTFLEDVDNSHGGPSRSVPILVKGLSEVGVKITLMTYRSENMNTHMLNSTSVNLKILETGTSFKEIESYILIEGFELIQMQSMWSLSYHKLSLIARKHKIPYIITPRGMLEPWSLNQNKWKKKLALAIYQMNDLKKASCIFTTAEMEAKHIRELGLKNPISIIPNGLETSDYVCRSNINNVKKQILFLSRIHVKKGIEILIEAFSRLYTDFTEWNVAIVGNGDEDYISSLKAKVKDLGLQERVKILPPVFGIEKSKLYQESSLFCLPSYSENFGMVVAEAMACGVPVITTNGTPWQLLNGDCSTMGVSFHGMPDRKTGWCITLSVENLENTLREAMSMPLEVLYEMGQRGSKLINDNFNYISVAKKTKELYEWILNCRNMPTPSFVKEI